MGGGGAKKNRKKEGRGKKKKKHESDEKVSILIKYEMAMDNNTFIVSKKFPEWCANSIGYWPINGIIGYMH